MFRTLLMAFLLYRQRRRYPELFDSDAAALAVAGAIEDAERA